ncbi:uncharacterized protein [Pituophis catenifer annectens]|uniref:uncharacterized protein n=1 Tax=Pituophis catenifer annectens TaxID=94852 RepID=UPI00399668DD
MRLSKTDPMHTVLCRLRHKHHFAKPENFTFDLQQVDFLGYPISTKGIQMDPQKVQAVLVWHAPHTAKDVQLFLGFANFYRTFIPGFAHKAKPLTQLTKKRIKFAWTSIHQTIFE